MRSYLLVTGVIFALLTIAHLWRMIWESHALATTPWFVGITILSAVLSGWAFRLAMKQPRAS